MSFIKILSTSKISVQGLKTSGELDGMNLAEVVKVCAALNSKLNSLYGHVKDRQPRLSISEFQWIPEVIQREDGLGAMYSGAVTLYVKVNPQCDNQGHCIDDPRNIRFRLGVEIYEFFRSSNESQKRLRAILLEQEAEFRKRPVFLLTRDEVVLNSITESEKDLKTDDTVVCSHGSIARYIVRMLNSGASLAAWGVTLGTKMPPARIGPDLIASRIAKMGPVASHRMKEVEGALVRGIRESESDIWLALDANVVELRKKVADVLIDQRSVFTGKFKNEVKNHGKCTGLNQLIDRIIDFSYSPIFSRVIHGSSSPRGAVIREITQTVKNNAIGHARNGLRISAPLQYILPFQGSTPIPKAL